MVGLAGCAPAGVSSNRSLGASQRAPAEPAEVVVVQAEPDPEQARADEVRRQRREIAQLREQLAADRSRNEAETARAEAAALEAQASITALQKELAEVRTRADTASAQSNQALATATEFLSNLVAAREEQRVSVERNLQSFNALDRRLRETEGRISEADQRRQADLAQTGSRSAELESGLQRTDQGLAQLRLQLADLIRENERTRAAIDSGPMLRMLRDLEATQHETTILRGLVEELQREQQESRKRLQDYYVDLDTRIQALQDRQREQRPDDVQGFGGDGDPAPGATSALDSRGDEAAGDLSDDILKSGELGQSAGELLEAFEEELQRQGIEDGLAAPADAASPEAISGDATAAITSARDADAGGGFPATQDSESVPGVVSTIDSTPAVMFDHGDAGETGSGTGADLVEPLPVTTHGVIITDWTAGSLLALPDSALE